MIGRTIAQYQILEKIGEGGMGVVYKARDSSLERFVAIKVLPPERVADPERKRRFVQEARAVSALNHPHIVTVHGIASDADLDYIVMEFIAGKTLSQLIGRRGLKVNDALKYGAQIADALAGAHAAGIVHRDLKPGNVMVTDSGLVKVLDFGLAKLAEPATGELAVTETLKPQTEEGAIVGTVAYMSPEQAQAKRVDARSDIFSFGSVLYEMITGRRAFQGDSKLSTLSAILDKEPVPVSTIAEGTPPELEKLIARCLRKDPERRIQHMGDVKLALEELKEESESGKLHARERLLPRVPVWRVTALAFLAAAVAGTTWWLTRSPQPVPVPALTRLTSDSGLTTDPALSPDGKLLAYASDRSGEGNLDIYVRQIGGGEPIRLTREPADDHEPAFSPDGTRIAFRSEREGGGVYVVSALGGPARRIAPEGRRPQFSPDGNWIAYWVGYASGASFSIRNQCRTYVVASGGGTPRQVQSDFAAAAYPVWSPDGKHLLFLGNRDEKFLPEDAVDWWVTPLGPGAAIRTGAFEATRRLNLAGPLQVYPWALVAPTWQPEGDSLVFSARSGDSTNLWRIAISPKTWKVTGVPQRLTSGPTLEENPAVAPGLGGGVRLAFTSLNQNADIWSLPVEANRGRVSGGLQQLTHDSGADFYPSFSNDDSRMVFISTRSGPQEIWIKDLKTGEDSVLTATRSAKYLPRFSPDGSKVSFSSYENRQWNGYVIPVGGGVAERICDDCGQLTSWSSDAKRMLGNSVYGRVWYVELGSRRKVDLLNKPGYWFCCPRFSPDDRWIAFSGTSKGSERTYIARFSGESQLPESAWITVTQGNLVRWSPDGTLLYGFSDRDGFLCIWAQRLDPTTKHPSAEPFAIFHSHGSRRSLMNQSDLVDLFVAHNQLLFSMGDRTGNIWMAEWKER